MAFHHVLTSFLPFSARQKRNGQVPTLPDVLPAKDLSSASQSPTAQYEDPSNSGPLKYSFSEILGIGWRWFSALCWLLLLLLLPSVYVMIHLFVFAHIHLQR
jgi:hypothetical protein